MLAKTLTLMTAILMVNIQAVSITEAKSEKLTNKDLDRQISESIAHIQLTEDLSGVDIEKNAEFH